MYWRTTIQKICDQNTRPQIAAGLAQQKFPSKALPATNAELQKYAGTYRWLNQLTFQSNVEAKKYSVHKVIGDSLYLEFSTNDVFALIKVGENIFKDPDYPVWSVFSQVHPDSAMEVTIYQQENNSQTWHWKKETSAKKQYSKEQLQKLTGNYYSKHLDFYWTIVMNDAGDVNWFDVHNPRLMHHRFDKVKD